MLLLEIPVTKRIYIYVKNNKWDQTQVLSSPDHRWRPGLKIVEIKTTRTDSKEKGRLKETCLNVCNVFTLFFRFRCLYPYYPYL